MEAQRAATAASRPRTCRRGCGTGCSGNIQETSLLAWIPLHHYHYILRLDSVEDAENVTKLTKWREKGGLGRASTGGETSCGGPDPCVSRRISTRYLTPIQLARAIHVGVPVSFLDAKCVTKVSRFTIRSTSSNRLCKASRQHPFRKLSLHAWRLPLFSASNGLLSMVAVTTSIFHSNSTARQT